MNDGRNLRTTRKRNTEDIGGTKPANECGLIIFGALRVSGALAEILKRWFTRCGGFIQGISVLEM
jgi:hypothetical protein